MRSIARTPAFIQLDSEQKLTGVEILAGFGCVRANLFGGISCTRKPFHLIAGSVSAVIALIASIKSDKSGTVWHTKADVAINCRSYGDVICHSDFDSQWYVNFEEFYLMKYNNRYTGEGLPPSLSSFYFSGRGLVNLSVLPRNN